VTAAQTIRERFDIPVVFLTAFAADDILARAKLAEPYGYILKPFSERELSTVLEMALYKYTTESRLKESTQNNQTILDNMVDGVITINEFGEIDSFNNAACRIFGYTQAQVLGRNVSVLMPEPHHSHHDGYLQHYRKTGEARMMGTPRDEEGRRQDGSIFPMALSVSGVTRRGQTTFIGLVRDRSEHQHDLEEIRRLAFYDSLTGLPNRRLLLDRLHQAMLTSGRSGQHGALMFMDLDHFKQLNDALGHDVGDKLLQQVAGRLRDCIRESDSVARLGGDEFLVLLEGLNTHPLEAATQSEMLAIKMLETLGQPYALGTHTYTCTPSIGIVLFLEDQHSLEDLLKMADVAMYQAKSSGRNTICFFDPAMQAAAAGYAALEKDLRNGLAAQEFALHYQIQVSGSGETTGAEALVRWNHSTRGMVSPAQFIPLAEETGLILPLGQWVMESACAQLVQWAKNPQTARWTVAVNVSASQFAQADFEAKVITALQKTGANPQQLKLELTESMLITDVNAIIQKMNVIRELGVTFSLDDFGTGYSSLSYLKRLPLAQLKIDQSFVRDILTDPSDAVIARTILALGHNLGLRVIAEGVETAEQHHFLASLGCDAFQGYFFGRPATAQALVARTTPRGPESPNGWHLSA
jgi:diguanylate cyclase (GGDEF)-like protein/PAS domain S-box-containing protein